MKKILKCNNEYEFNMIVKYFYNKSFGFDDVRPFLWEYPVYIFKGSHFENSKYKWVNWTHHINDEDCIESITFIRQEKLNKINDTER